MEVLFLKSAAQRRALSSAGIGVRALGSLGTGSAHSRGLPVTSVPARSFPRDSTGLTLCPLPGLAHGPETPAMGAAVVSLIPGDPSQNHPGDALTSSPATASPPGQPGSPIATGDSDSGPG